MREVTVDTSIFMECSKALNKIITEYTVVIPLVVLEELDNLKDGNDRLAAYKARTAIRFINENYHKVIFDHDGEREKSEKNDNTIIRSALERGSAIISRDLCMKVKAKALGVEVIEINGVNDEEYKGYKVKYIDTLNDADQALIGSIMDNTDDNSLGLRINEYLIIRDAEDNERTIVIVRWTGEGYAELKFPRRGGVTPLNDLQQCALDLLHNDQILVKGIFGNAGCGKTYLATKVGLYHIKASEKYKKMMIVRNPIGPGEQIGFLKGEKEDKIGDFFKPVIQHLDNGEVEAMDLMNKGKLEKEIPNYMKGLDIQNTYILVDEAEDLNREIIKLLGTRVSTGSCIVFTGDYTQSENKFKDNNGVKELITKAAGNPIFGCIVLEDDLRSKASKMFGDLF